MSVNRANFGHKRMYVGEDEPCCLHVDNVHPVHTISLEQDDSQLMQEDRDLPLDLSGCIARQPDSQSYNPIDLTSRPIDYSIRRSDFPDALKHSSKELQDGTPSSKSSGRDEVASGGKVSAAASNYIGTSCSELKVDSLKALQNFVRNFDKVSKFSLITKTPCQTPKERATFGKEAVKNGPGLKIVSETGSINLNGNEDQANPLVCTVVRQDHTDLAIVEDSQSCEELESITGSDNGSRTLALVTTAPAIRSLQVLKTIYADFCFFNLKEDYFKSTPTLRNLQGVSKSLDSSRTLPCQIPVEIECIKTDPNCTDGIIYGAETLSNNSDVNEASSCGSIPRDHDYLALNSGPRHFEPLEPMSSSDTISNLSYDIVPQNSALVVVSDEPISSAICSYCQTRYTSDNSKPKLCNDCKVSPAGNF